MLVPGPARKVTIHLNEDSSSGSGFLYTEIFAFLRERGVAGATLTRPEAGFGSHHRIHSRESGSADHEHLPVRIEFIESLKTVEALLPSLCDLVLDGVVEAQDTTIVKSVVREQPN